MSAVCWWRQIITPPAIESLEHYAVTFSSSDLQGLFNPYPPFFTTNGYSRRQKNFCPKRYYSCTKKIYHERNYLTAFFLVTAVDATWISISIRESTLRRSVYPVTRPAGVNPLAGAYPDCSAATLLAGMIYGLRARRLDCE